MTDAEIRVVVTRGEGVWRGGGGKNEERDQLNGDQWKLNFWW